MSKSKNARAPKPTTAAEGSRGFTMTEDLIGEVVKSETIKFASRQGSAHYAPLISKVLSMKVGQSLPLTVPDDTTIERFRATVSTTLRKRTANQLGKNKLSFKTSTDGQLVISLVPAS